MKTRRLTEEWKANISRGLRTSLRNKEANRHRSLANKGRFLGPKHIGWKGEDASYSAKHKWVARMYGSASRCEFRDKTCSMHFEWSNKSGQYKRVFSDWQQLCVSHHRRYDGVIPSWVV